MTIFDLQGGIKGARQISFADQLYDIRYVRCCYGLEIMCSNCCCVAIDTGVLLVFYLPIIYRILGLMLQFSCYNILVACVRRFWFWCTDYVFMCAIVVAVHKCWLHVHRLLVTMDSCNEHVDRSPVRMSLTRRLFSTPVVVNDDAGHML
jgi:hypothetical protein